MTYINNESADQHAHIHRLICTFAVHCLGSIKAKFVICENLRILASLCS